METLTKLGKMFIDISLGYVDECCLGYTFYNETQNAYKSAADGVVVYAQNWKVLLKNAATTMVVVILAFIAITVVAMLLFGGLISLFGFSAEWAGIGGFILALLTAFAIKYAFIDTWILVKMMSTYMEVAPTTQITFDLYGKLRGWSSKFGELLKKGNSEPAPQSQQQPVTPPQAIPEEVQPNVQETPVAPPTTPEQPAPPKASNFCPECGAPLVPGAKFCGGCGTKVG
jgi:hypothetical protein